MSDEPQKKVVGRPFKKGMVANPLGGRAVNPVIRAIRKMTHTQIEEMGKLILEGNLSDLQAITKDPDASALKIMIASCVIKAINKGDPYYMNEILNRLVGKVKDRVEYSGDPENPIRLKVETMTADERKEQVLKYAKELKAIERSK